MIVDGKNKEVKYEVVKKLYMMRATVGIEWFLFQSDAYGVARALVEL